MSRGPSPRRSRACIAALAAVALCAAATSFGASAGVARTHADAVLNVTYVGTTSLQVRLGDGSTVRSGGTVPAGTYQVLVEDDDFATPNFKLSGPGVNISSNLDSSGMGIDHPAMFSASFQPSSTYTLQDTNIGASSAVTFSTSATATASGASNTGASSSSSGGSSSSSSSSSTSSGARTLGTLTASVSAAGRAAVAFGGKPVTKLKAGRYTISVQDRSRKAGLILWKVGSRPVTLSGAAATGSKSESVMLGDGRWFVEPSAAGPRTYFSVAG